MLLDLAAGRMCLLHDGHRPRSGGRARDECIPVSCLRRRSGCAVPETLGPVSSGSDFSIGGVPWRLTRVRSFPITSGETACRNRAGGPRCPRPLNGQEHERVLMTTEGSTNAGVSIVTPGKFRDGHNLAERSGMSSFET